MTSSHILVIQDTGIIARVHPRHVKDVLQRKITWSNFNIGITRTIIDEFRECLRVGISQLSQHDVVNNIISELRRRISPSLKDYKRTKLRLYKSIRELSKWLNYLCECSGKEKRHLCISYGIFLVDVLGTYLREVTDNEKLDRIFKLGRIIDRFIHPAELLRYIATALPGELNVRNRIVDIIVNTIVQTQTKNSVKNIETMSLKEAMMKVNLYFSSKNCMAEVDRGDLAHIIAIENAELKHREVWLLTCDQALVNTLKTYFKEIQNTKIRGVVIYHRDRKDIVLYDKDILIREN